MAELVVAAGILWWMLCGAAMAVAIVAWRGKRLCERHEIHAPHDAVERFGRGREGEDGAQVGEERDQGA